MTIKRDGTAVDEIYRVIHERIIDGTYPPRMRMSQVELAAELATSRTPLREALNRLQANGLVIATNNRGMTVAPVEYEKAQQWYCLRLLLEPSIVGEIVQEFTSADIKEMEAALQDMEKHRDDSLRAYQNAHHRFHEVALRRYPEAIREIIELIYDHITRHQLRHFSRPRIAQDFSHTDRHLLKAFRARDSQLARQLMEFHLLDAGLGLALDIDPAHIPKAVMMAARAIGLDIGVLDDGSVARPAKIRWTKSGSASMPHLKTANLEVDLESPSAIKSAAPDRRTKRAARS
jgi:DNA-binding GntR family transcriptional regulator